MKHNLTILIVDDHPMTIKGYEIFLRDLYGKYSFQIDSALSCDEVNSLIKRNKNNFYDLVLLDISLPPSRDKEIISGEELGLTIKRKFPMTRIIVHTGMNDQQRISNIFKNLNPEGFLIKSDIDPEVLSDAVSAVIEGDTFYSEMTNRLIGPSSTEDVFLDTTDQKILYHLSKGERMKDLPKYIHRSMATIERRKKKLKMLFGVCNGSDRELLDIAREKGFI